MKKLIILITLLISTSAFAGYEPTECTKNTEKWLTDDHMVASAYIEKSGRLTVFVWNAIPVGDRTKRIVDGKWVDPAEGTINMAFHGWNSDLAKSLKEKGCVDPVFIPYYDQNGENNWLKFRDSNALPLRDLDWARRKY